MNRTVKKMTRGRAGRTVSVDIMLTADAAQRLSDLSSQVTALSSQVTDLLWVLQSRELLTVTERNWITAPVESGH